MSLRALLADVGGTNARFALAGLDWARLPRHVALAQGDAAWPTRPVRIVSGDPEGVHAVEITVRGLSGLLRTADGVVVLGAGYLVLHEVFNGDEFVSREIIIDRGPHPNIESDLALFCEVTTDALGLS